MLLRVARLTAIMTATLESGIRAACAFYPHRGEKAESIHSSSTMSVPSSMYDYVEQYGRKYHRYKEGSK
jgi:hypothetical protein